MHVVYKRCRERDLIPAYRLVLKSLNHLRKKTGKEAIRIRIRKNPEIIHLLRQDRETFWCAWAGKNIVGFGAALVRGKQWWLAYLFIHPRYQDHGVGRELIRRVWRDAPGMSHSLSTFAFNMQAVGLYSKFGMTPLCTIPSMDFDLRKNDPAKLSGLEVVTNPKRSDLVWIKQFEGKIRGYARPQDWRFWSEFDRTRIFLFKDKGRRVGYSLAYDNGFIGPAGAVTNSYLTKVVSDTIGLLRPKERKIEIFCPTRNMKLYLSLIGMGFRLVEMETFMSDADYPDFQRYVPGHLTLF